MPLDVVGYKLKRLSAWSIRPSVENNGLKAYIRFCELHVGITVSRNKVLPSCECILYEYEDKHTFAFINLKSTAIYIYISLIIAAKYLENDLS